MQREYKMCPNYISLRYQCFRYSDDFVYTVDSRYLEIEGTLKTLRDIRTSTYQICRIE